MGIFYIAPLFFACSIALHTALLELVVPRVIAIPRRATLGCAVATSTALHVAGIAYFAVFVSVMSLVSELSVGGMALALSIAVALRTGVIKWMYSLSTSDAVVVEIVLWACCALLGAAVGLAFRAPYVVGGALVLAATVVSYGKLSKRRDAAFFREVSAALDRKNARA